MREGFQNIDKQERHFTIEKKMATVGPFEGWGVSLGLGRGVGQ